MKHLHPATIGGAGGGIETSDDPPFTPLPDGIETSDDLPLVEPLPDELGTGDGLAGLP